jgi:hypothetical protein
MVAAPSPLVMLVDGTLLIGFSIFNLYRWLQQPTGGRTPGFVGGGGSDSYPVWPMLFIITLLSGIGRFRRYKRFKAALPYAPSPATMDWLKQMHRFLRLASVKRVPTMIRLDATQFPPFQCKAQLLPDLAVCLVNGQRLRFVPEREFVIHAPPTATGKKIKTKATLGSKTYTVAIGAESLQRYHAWKREAEPEVQLELDETETATAPDVASAQSSAADAPPPPAPSGE